MSFWKSLGKGLAKAASKAASFIPVVGTYVSDVADSMISDWESSEARKQQMSDSKAMMQYQNDLNMQNWQMQNEYNTPAAQLQRYQDAGINPLAVGIDGGAAATPAAVSGQSAPDIGSILQYQIEAARAKTEIALAREDLKSKKIENKAAAVESDARIAESHVREIEAQSRSKEYQRSTPPDDREGWQRNGNTWTRTDGNNVEVVLADTAIDQAVRASLQHQVSDAKAAATAVKLADLDETLKRTYGAALEDVTWRRLEAEVLKLDLDNQLQKLDVEFLNSIGIGGRMAQGILSLILKLMR